MRASLLSIAIPALLCVTAIGSPPPQERSPAPSQQGEPDDRAWSDRGTAAEHLQRRLETVRREEERVIEAIAMLDHGATPAEVHEFMRRDRRSGFRERFSGDAPTADEILEVLAELNPRLHARLSGAREEFPEEFENQVRRLTPRLRHLVYLREHEPDLWLERVREMRLEHQARRAARIAVNAPTDEARQEAIETLRDSVSQHVDIRIGFHERRLAGAEAEIEEGRQRLEAHRARRTELIEERVATMLEEAEARPAGPDGHGDQIRPRRRRAHPGDG